MRNLVFAKSAAAVAAAAFVLMGGSAQAAPQALGLIATNGEVELNCVGETCHAELSAFCLQSDRYSPARGTRYEVVGDGVRLVGTDAAGHTVELSAAERLTFNSLRSHVAVKVSMPRSELDRLGVDRVNVVVGRNAALLPVAQAGDLNPHTPIEITRLVRSLRPMGADVVDGNSDRMIAAHATSYMINTLPAHVRTDKQASEQAWRTARRQLDDASASVAARGMAEHAYEFCEFAASRNTFSNIRSCLQIQHDKFMKSLNAEYWEATKPGS